MPNVKLVYNECHLVGYWRIFTLIDLQVMCAWPLTFVLSSTTDCSLSWVWYQSNMIVADQEFLEKEASTTLKDVS